MRPLWLLACLFLFVTVGCSDRVSQVMDATPAADASTPDLPVADSRVADFPLPDSAAPDQLIPDQLIPDQLIPDQLIPDLLIPDQLIPDLPPPTCTDKVKNNGESDTDCGGKYCPPCVTGQGCGAHSDCASGYCDATGKCAQPTCTDTVKNSSETDTDCGGPLCPRCADTLKCKAPSDCLSGVCSGGICAKATCMDKVKNGAEIGVDCGGGTCPACANGTACKACGDCASGFCDGLTKKCAVPRSCADIKKDCPTAGDGEYLLDPDGSGGTAAFKGQCEMTFLGGGWLAVYNMMKLPGTNAGAATMYKSITTRAAMTSAVTATSSSAAIHTSNLPLKDFTEVVYGWALSSAADVTRYGTYKETGGLAAACYLAKTCSNNAKIATFSIMPQKITRDLYTGNNPTYPHVGIGWASQQILWGYDNNNSSYGHWANWNSSTCCYAGNTADTAKAGWRYVIYIR